ncbi:BTB/POZ domain-containing protein At2g24240-like [Solanum lycopersicum]|uniref:BTB/POZ domain-containing protein At2g24240-like n=1 Tax=Solanum lycopersicum TaxID=4081 RepID=UPI000532F472|nr:BTB/POZ domain-containing protein At4g30940-like [Solanum lycopersicum]
MESQKNRVKLNVGGKKFETTATTLASGGRTSFFGAMFNDDWNLHSDGSITEIFIDRNPEYFGVLLDLLRTGELYIPPKIDKKHLYREALYYGIEDHLRLAKWGPFDGNRLRLAESIKGPTKGKAEKIRASPNSWCCVVRDNIVSVYNWMLEEKTTITTRDYRRVNDVCWVNSDNIAVSSSDKYLASEGIGLFTASTGELKYNFQVKDEDQLKDYTAGALGVGSDYKLFSSCTEITNKKNGIAVWDQITGKQTDFLQYLPYSKATKLQWLQGLNECLGFLDFRRTNTSVNWRYKKDSSSDMCFPKLVFHEGQLFSSLNNSISVYSGSDWLPTSQLRKSPGGPICDFFNWWYQLFALHKDENVIDLWETPRPPVI